MEKTSELESSQQTLQARQSFIAGIMQASPVGIIHLDADGNVSFANTYAEQLFGLSANSLQGAGYSIIESMLKDTNENPIDAQQMPLSLATKYRKTQYNLEYRVDIAGTSRYLSVNITPSFRSGKLHNALLAIVDITEKTDMQRELTHKQQELQQINEDLEKRVEMEVRQRVHRESLISAIYDAANVGICITDGMMRIVHANQAFCSMFDIHPAEVSGESMLTFIPPERHHAYRKKHHNLMQFSDQDRGVERTMLRRDGAPLDVLVSRRVMTTEDDEPALLSIITDISRIKHIQREKEQQEKLLIQQTKMAAMGEMISAIAHQWRQPLNTMSMLVQDIRDAYRFGELDEHSLNDKVQRAMDTFRYMSTTIDDFRNFFVPDKDKEEFDLLDVLYSVAHMLHDQYRSHQVYLYRRFPRSRRRVILTQDSDQRQKYPLLGYPNETKQVIFNLFNNAHDAIIMNRERLGDDYEGWIEVELTRLRQGRVRLKVSDNGGGIPSEVMSRIFEPYFTTKEQTKGAAVVGTGIGLYMAKIIVEESMQGKITVHNCDDGAVFTVEM
nr:PAS domain-containing sensor histidine kinase [Desulfurispira natronophila]